jgi:DNA-binding response OmpR family regulator
MPGVLIVEDDKELREMLKLSLSRRNFTVFEADNGKSAIAHFKPTITDLVVTDLIMPEEDGLKVVIKLRELKPTIKIIAISGGGKVGQLTTLLQKLSSCWRVNNLIKETVIMKIK